jgi:hypothetical protein
MDKQAALAMQKLGFRILGLGEYISVDGPQSLWESTFNVTFETRTHLPFSQDKKGKFNYQKALVAKLHIPEKLRNLIQKVLFVEPPTLY